MTLPEPAKDVIRTITCRNIRYAVQILKDSEHDLWKAGMTDELDKLSEIVTRLGILGLAMDANCWEDDE